VQNNNVAMGIDWWCGRVVLQGNVTSATISSFGLGQFVSSNDARGPISQTHFIDNLGRLTALNPTVIVFDGTITRGFGSLAPALDSIRTAGNYTVTLLTNQTVGTSRTLNVANANITLTGDGTMRTIAHDNTNFGVMFTINGATTTFTLGNNITVQGAGGGVPSGLLQVQDGTFNMQPGSRITGHRSTSSVTVSIGGAAWGTAVFNMNGGEITGNRNTVTSTGTGLSAGLSIASASTFNMNGGSITNNNLGVGNNSSDVVGSVNLNGNAQIGTLTLSASATENGRINIGNNFTGSVATLHLRGSDTNMTNVVNWWNGRTVLEGNVAPNFTRFGLGDFITSQSANARRAISPTHHINAAGILTAN
jgi:hypothetical protein